MDEIERENLLHGPVDNDTHVFHGVNQGLLRKSFFSDEMNERIKKREQEIMAEQEAEQKKFEDFMAQFVDKYYEMDPEEDDLLINSSRLKEGMCVLSESPMERVFLDNILTDPTRRYEAMRNNRWCVVEQIVDYHSFGYFVGRYQDGIKMLWKYDTYEGWYVKKSSIPTKQEDGKVIVLKDGEHWW